MIEALLVTALGPLVDGRVFPDMAPEETSRPYCTYQQVGGVPINFVGAEASDKKNARMQITVWSDTRVEAAAIARQIEDVMVAAPLYGLIEGGAIARHDPQTGYRGSMQDFSFWS